MRREDLWGRCLGKPWAVEDYPYGEDVAVFKVGGRGFALCGLRDDPPTVSLKCDPEEALALRAAHPAVTPGYHLNKRHWNTVVLDGSIDDAEGAEMVDASYDLVVAGLPRRERDLLGPDATR